MTNAFRWIFVLAVLVAWWPIPMTATQLDAERARGAAVFTSPSAIVGLRASGRPSPCLPLAAVPVIIALRFF